jgi:hypothetical protein
MTPQHDRFAHSLRAAIDASGLSARELARRCTSAGAQVSAPTLRSWASGESGPVRRASLETVDVLEKVLGVRTGELSGLLQVSYGAPLPGESPFAQLSARLASLRERHGLPADGLLTRELISTTLDLDAPGTPRLRHRVMASAAVSGVDGLLALVHDGELEIDEIEAHGGATLAVERVDREHLGVAIRLPRPLEIGEVALVDLSAPVRADLCAPGRLSTLAPWPASLIVAALRAEGRAYAGRAVRTDHDQAEPRVRSRDLDLLPESTGMQCVARDVRASEVAVHWRPFPASP